MPVALSLPILTFMMLSVPINFSWECEDYDFGGGQFIDNPVYTFVGPGPNTYYQEENFVWN